MGNALSNSPATPTSSNAAAAYGTTPAPSPSPPSERTLKNAFSNLNSLKTKAVQINGRVSAAEEKLKALEAAKAAAAAAAPAPAPGAMAGGRRSSGKGRKGKGRKTRRSNRK